MNQEYMIFEHLKAGNKLTPLEALNRFGCFRLGARMFNIKKYSQAHGFEVHTRIISHNGKRFAEYWFEALCL